MSLFSKTLAKIKAYWNAATVDPAQSRPFLKPIQSPRCLRKVYVCIARQAHEDEQALFNRVVYELPRLLQGEPIYLHKKAALRHGCYQAYECAVLKFFVPEHAIIAQSSALQIDTTQVSPDHLHGCYFLNEASKPYYHNPFFNTWFEEFSTSHS